MKKSILIFGILLTTLSLTAFGYMNWGNSRSNQKEVMLSGDNLESIINKETSIDLIYNVKSRFNTTITKDKLNKATSVVDIYPEHATRSIASYQEVKISTLHNDVELKASESGKGEMLNAAQLKLLQSADVSTNIHITANCKTKNVTTGELYDHYIVYYMTIGPEKEAEYEGGYDALIEYLRESSKEETAIIKKDKLRPGKVTFTVTKKGGIGNVKLTSTSGYDSVDKTLIELVKNIPGKWHSATNSKGEKVDEELVFFFGLEGC